MPKDKPTIVSKDRHGIIFSTSIKKHVHRYLPSGNPTRCAWRCACGDYFIVCICGKCPAEFMTLQ